MINPEMEKWESFLTKSFDEIDSHLEEKYGKMYPLHPNRPARGETSSSSRDGLFNVGAAFTAGYGSEYGRGWVIEVDMVTLAHVPAKVQETIEEEVAAMIREKIDRRYGPGKVGVKRDGSAFKIFGDFGLRYSL